MTDHAALLPSGHDDTFARDRLPHPDLWPTLDLSAVDVPDRLNAGVDLLDRAIAAHGPDRPALLTPDGETWTYGALRERVRSLAHLLREQHGLRPGERVLLRSPNNPALVACWLGALQAGAVVVTTMPALRSREVGALLERTRPRLALVDHRSVEELDAAIAAHEEPVERLVVGGGGPDDVLTRLVPAPDLVPSEVSCDDVALLCPTSGTTGQPKVTMHFHRDVLAIAQTFGRHVVELRPDDVVACTAPLAFTFGLGASVVFPLDAGASVLLVEAATPPVLAELVADHEVTVLFTAPTAYRAILRAGLVEHLRGVRRAFSAGEHLPQSTWEALRDAIGLEVVDGIGSTELLHIFLSTRPGQMVPGSTGTPVPGYRAAVLDEDGRELPPGEPGRLAVVGPTGCRYLDDPRQRDYVAHGWNLTGDTFVRDADGSFRYVGRNDAMIVSSGYNIAGPEVEEALLQHPAVLECAVVGRPDPDRGSVVCAFVVPRPGTVGDDALARELQDFVKQTIAPYKYPRDVQFAEALPRNASGKVQHFVLRHQVADEAAASGASGAATTSATPGAAGSTAR